MQKLQSPAEIVWLNGAPGSGKGTNTPYILESRGLARAVTMCAHASGASQHTLTNDSFSTHPLARRHLAMPECGGGRLELHPWQAASILSEKGENCCKGCSA